MRHLMAATALGLAVAACTQPVSVVTEESARVHTITVTGVGETTGVPDILVVELGVSVVRTNVAEATSETARLAADVIAALKATGVVEADIRTTSYSIWPEYDYRSDTPTITGYRVSNTVSAKIRDLDASGTVMDAAVAAGGNDIVVNAVSFDLEEDAELLTAAREAAWADARAKADQLAGLAAVNLGAVVSVSETLSSTPSTPYGAVQAEGDSGTTPILPGEMVVSVVIEVSFEIGA